MPRSKTGQKLRPVDKTKLERAVMNVVNRKMSLREALNEANQSADTNPIALTTLQRHVKLFLNEIADDPLPVEERFYKHTGTNATASVFSVEEEVKVVHYLKTLAHMKYGLTTLEARRFLLKYAVANECSYTETWDRDQQTGKRWMVLIDQQSVNFLKILKKFIENLASGLADRIYNIDETGVTTVQSPGKIIAPKGSKQVGKVTSRERGELVTVISAISAAGHFEAPHLVIPRKRMKDVYLKNAYRGTTASFSSSGWSSDEIFSDYFTKLISRLKPSKSDPVLIIYDNHDSHLNPRVIEMAKKGGVFILTLPPHTSNKLQPLDVGVFKSFKSAFNREVDTYMFNHPNKMFTLYEVAEAVGNAYQVSFTPKNIRSGFSATGIFPLNPDIFTDEDFLCSYVSDRNLPSEPNPIVQDSSHVNKLSPATPTSLHSDEQAPRTSTPILLPLAEKSLSLAENSLPSAEKSFISSTPGSRHSSKLIISPQTVALFPKASPRKMKNSKRQKITSAILTNSPVLQALKDKKEKLSVDLKKNKNNPKKRKQMKNDERAVPARKKLNFEGRSNLAKRMVKECIEEPVEESIPHAYINFDPLVDEFEVGDFVIVRYPFEMTTTGFKNFIAEILHVKKGQIYGSFLKNVPTKQNNGFVYNYPDIKSIWPFKIDQIRRKLQSPLKYLRSHFLFNIHVNTLQNI